jgi:hypothetical protein
MPRPATFLLLLCLLSACAGSQPAGSILPGPTATSGPIPLPTLASTTPSVPTATTAPAPTEAGTPVPAAGVLPRYTLEVVLDFEAHALTVHERIDYQNLTGQALQELWLVVEPNHWQGCFSLEAAQVGGVRILVPDLDGHRLIVPLADGLAQGAHADLELDYRLSLPPADNGQVFGYSALQTSLVDWYPFVAPFDPQAGWLLYAPSGVGEHLVLDPAVLEITFRLVGSPLPLAVAASVPGDFDGTAWHYRAEALRSFALSVSPSFQSETLVVGGIPVTSYYYAEDAAAGRVALQETARALAVFHDRFGPYPYPSLSVVESLFFDGMEYDGLFFLSRAFYRDYDGTVLNDLITIAVHETAHQWWYGSVGNDQALEPWLDEALATYSESLFYAQVYPSVSAWQAFRIDAYAPAGNVDSSIYQLTGFRPYANAVYLRGALFLQDLHLLIGEQAFSAFLKDYAAQMAGRRASTVDFFRILGGHTQADLAPLIGGYFEGTYP